MKHLLGALKWAVLAMIGFLALCLVGCVGVTAWDADGRKVSIHAPAYPWSDVSQTFAKLNVSIATNRMTFAMLDSATDSHFSPVVGDIVGKAVAASIETFAHVAMPASAARSRAEPEAPAKVAATNAPGGGK